MHKFPMSFNLKRTRDELSRLYLATAWTFSTLARHGIQAVRLARIQVAASALNAWKIDFEDWYGVICHMYKMISMSSAPRRRSVRQYRSIELCP